MLADNGLAPSFDVAPDGGVLALVAPPDSGPGRRPTNVTVAIDLFSAL